MHNKSKNMTNLTGDNMFCKLTLFVLDKDTNKWRSSSRILPYGLPIKNYMAGIVKDGTRFVISEPIETQEII